MARLSIAVAVALLFLSSAASAKIPVLQLGADFCDFMPIQVDRAHGKAHGFSNFSCETGNFVGVIAKVNGERAIIASVQVLKDRPGDQFLLQISYRGSTAASTPALDLAAMQQHTSATRGTFSHQIGQAAGGATEANRPRAARAVRPRQLRRRHVG